MAEDAEEGASLVRATASGLGSGVPPELFQDRRRRWPAGHLLRTDRKETTLRAYLVAASPDVGQTTGRRTTHPEEDHRWRVMAITTTVL